MFGIAIATSYVQEGEQMKKSLLKQIYNSLATLSTAFIFIFGAMYTMDRRLMFIEICAILIFIMLVEIRNK